MRTKWFLLILFRSKKSHFNGHNSFWKRLRLRVSNISTIQRVVSWEWVDEGKSRLRAALPLDATRKREKESLVRISYSPVRHVISHKLIESVRKHSYLRAKSSRVAFAPTNRSRCLVRNTPFADSKHYFTIESYSTQQFYAIGCDGLPDDIINYLQIALTGSHPACSNFSPLAQQS